jgi:hypothetical protein
MDYVDPEVLLVAWADANLSPATGTTELPPDDPPGSFVDGLPYVLINHIGGADDQPTLADLTIDVGYYGAADDQGSLSALARKGHHLLRFGLPGSILTKGSMSATVTTVRTSFLPFPDYTYGNPAVLRYLSSYAITFKARRAA